MSRILSPCLSSIRAGVSFLLVALSFPASLPAADAAYYGVVKSVQYEQTAVAPPAVLASNAYTFSAFAVASTNGLLTNATFRVGAGAEVPLLPDTSALSWRFEQSFNSQAALDAAYPAGSAFSPVNYTVTMYGTNDGPRSGGLNFFLLIFAIAYPTTPELMDLSPAQAIDTTRDYQLNWNSLGGSTIAVVQLSILDASSNAVTMSPLPFSPGALNGASTSYVIPANSLPPGAELIGHLTIGNPGTPNTNSYPGAAGFPAVGKDTKFPLKTRPSPPAPLLSILPRDAGQFQFIVTGETNRLYQVQASPNLQTWTNIFTTNCLTGSFRFSDSNSLTEPRQFYRAKVGQ